MFTDMVGYTSLGQRNESLSLALAEEQRKLLRPIFARHNGREVKTMGDGFLVEFPSALEAVRCAYDVQRATREFNISLSDEKRVHLRVGVHLGDVVESGGDISGDAVNVASRIEALAEDGGVCLSQQVYDHIQNKFELPLVSLGSRLLMNVSVPIELYKIVMPWIHDEGVTSPRSEQRRIAVLPFANFSPDPNDEYFADGMTEEIISTVSRVNGLQVISRTSVMGYKGTNKRANEIGRELRVGSLLEGSVRKSGSRMRITVQLINVGEDQPLWSQSYDRELNDIFALQSDIAKQVADSLSLRIRPEEAKLIEKRPTQDVEAYELYLKGRHQWNKRTKEGLHRAIEHFQRAVERDPVFALAYSGMADCYVVLPGYDPQPQLESFRKAKEFSIKALELDDTLAEAHTSLALSLSSYEWDWKGAEREYSRAIELNPNYSTAHQWYGTHLIWYTGRFEEGIKELRRAADLDPLSPIIGMGLAQAYAYASRWDDAIIQSKMVLDLLPNFWPAQNVLMLAYRGKSMYTEAISEGIGALGMVPIDIWVKIELGLTYGTAGMQEEATRILGEVLDLQKKEYVPPVAFIHLYFSVGEMDKMYDWMQRAYDQHDISIPQRRWDPDFAKIRAEPRFTDLMKKVGLD
jgi:adenylate cyclase